MIFTRLVTEAHAAGALEPAGPCPPAPPVLGEDLARGRAALLIDAPDDVAARALTAWAGMYETVSFELFGQFNNVIEERAAYFDHTMTLLGRLVGFQDVP